MTLSGWAAPWGAPGAGHAVTSLSALDCQDDISPSWGQVKQLLSNVSVGPTQTPSAHDLGILP